MKAVQLADSSIELISSIFNCIHLDFMLQDHYNHVSISF